MIISRTHLFKCSQSLECFLAFLVYPFFFLLLLLFFLVSFLYLNKHIFVNFSEVLRKRGTVTWHYYLLRPPHLLPMLQGRTALSPQDQGWRGSGAPLCTNLSPCVMLCKYKTFFFNHSPSERYDADANILCFLQPVAIWVDDFLCSDPGGII